MTSRTVGVSGRTSVISTAAWAPACDHCPRHASYAKTLRAALSRWAYPTDPLSGAHPECTQRLDSLARNAWHKIEAIAQPSLSRWDMWNCRSCPHLRCDEMMPVRYGRLGQEVMRAAARGGARLLPRGRRH